MTDIIDRTDTRSDRNRQGGNALARHLWAIMECDPEDTSPPWRHAQAAVRARYEERARDLACRLIDLGWQPPVAQPRRHWNSVLEVPDGTQFRIIGETRIFRRAGNYCAREIRPDRPGDLESLTALERRGRRGFIEVR